MGRLRGAEAGRSTVPVWIGWTGVVSIAVGYGLELIRQRGTCDTGDKSPDTLVISVVLIVLVGGLCGLVGLVGTVVPAVRHRRTVSSTIRAAGPAVLALAGALTIFAIAGRGPSTWFQYCGT